MVAFLYICKIWKTVRTDIEKRFSFCCPAVCFSNLENMKGVVEYIVLICLSVLLYGMAESGRFSYKAGETTEFAEQAGIVGEILPDEEDPMAFYGSVEAVLPVHIAADFAKRPPVPEISLRKIPAFKSLYNDFGFGGRDALLSVPQRNISYNISVLQQHKFPVLYYIYSLRRIII